VRTLGLLVVDIPVWPSGEHFLQRDASLNPCERGTKTEVNSMPEGQVSGLPVDVESVRVVELSFVTVGGSVEQ